MKTYPLKVQRLHASDGDLEDLGWYSKGHHTEAEFREAWHAAHMLTPFGETKAEFVKHPSEADETKCTFSLEWWRTIPRGDGYTFRRAPASARGSFPVTALLSPEADI